MIKCNNRNDSIETVRTTLNLSKSEQLALTAQTKSSFASEARRARVILLLARGHSWATIRDKLKCNDSFIDRWGKRFSDERMSGLLSRKAHGSPTILTAEMEARILEWSVKSMPVGLTCWSTRKLAKQIGVSHMMIARVWRKHQLRLKSLGAEGVKQRGESRSRENVQQVLSARDPLSRERIVATSIALMDRRGMRALTMRKLGADLKVQAMSLYDHFPSKKALLSAARTELFARISGVSANEGDSFERLRAVMRATYQLGGAHPCFVELLFDSSSEPISHRRAADLSELRSAGFSPQEALYALQSLVSFVIGFLHQGWLTVMERDDAGFEFGLDLLLDGLRRAVASKTIASADVTALSM